MCPSDIGKGEGRENAPRNPDVTIFSKEKKGFGETEKAASLQEVQKDK